MANIEALKSVRHRIQKFPENFNYFAVCLAKKVGRSREKLKDLVKQDCNTCGCVLGFTLVEKTKAELKHTTHWVLGKEMLGLSEREATFLFTARGHCPYNATDTYLVNYPYKEDFDYDSCEHEEGILEAINRLSYIIDHYESMALNSPA